MEYLHQLTQFWEPYALLITGNRKPSFELGLLWRWKGPAGPLEAVSFAGLLRTSDAPLLCPFRIDVFIDDDSDLWTGLRIRNNITIFLYGFFTTLYVFLLIQYHAHVIFIIISLP